MESAWIDANSFTDDVRERIAVGGSLVIARGEASDDAGRLQSGDSHAIGFHPGERIGWMIDRLARIFRVDGLASRLPRTIQLAEFALNLAGQTAELRQIIAAIIVIVTVIAVIVAVIVSIPVVGIAISIAIGIVSIAVSIGIIVSVSIIVSIVVSIVISIVIVSTVVIVVAVVVSIVIVSVSVVVVVSISIIVSVVVSIGVAVGVVISIVIGVSAIAVVFIGVSLADNLASSSVVSLDWGVLNVFYPFLASGAFALLGNQTFAGITSQSHLTATPASMLLRTLKIKLTKRKCQILHFLGHSNRWNSRANIIIPLPQ